MTTTPGSGGGDLGQQLLDAAAVGDRHRVAAALDAGAAIDHANEYGFNALGSALWESHMPVARLLVERGATVAIDDAAALGDTAALEAEWPDAPPVSEAIGAYLMACRTGALASIRWFLRRGIDVDLHPPGAEWGGIGSPGLHHAAVNGHLDAVHMLLEAGADPTLVDDVHGSQALAWAASGGHTNVVRMLHAAGADPAHRNAHGRTAADLARDNGYPELADEIEG